MRALCVVVMAIVVGCVVASCGGGGGSGDSQQPVSSGNGAVTVRVVSSCPDQTILADGQVIGSVASGATGTFEMPPGQYNIQACDTMFDCYQDVAVVEAGIMIEYTVSCVAVGALVGVTEEIRQKHMLAE